MEIYKANQQWSTRPADERFMSLEDLYTACKHYADTAVEKNDTRVDSLRVETYDSQVQIVSRSTNRMAALTHWAFGQLCARIGAPASYLRELPATLACQNVNHGLAKRLSDRGKDAMVNLLFHQNGGLLLRALTSDRYERIWNWEIAERLVGLQVNGWAPARPTIRVDLDPNGVRLPLYASDHDMFVFLAHGERTIDEPGNPGGLLRGLIVENSEVGASKLRLTRFLYREMCGNHIIWDASNVSELALRHVGNIRDRMHLWNSEIRRYMETSASLDEAKIRECVNRKIAGTKDEVLDAIFGKRIPGLTRQTIEAGYDSVQNVDGDPRTSWGIVQGLTRYSQTLPYADKRTEIDRAAGKILDVF